MGYSTIQKSQLAGALRLDAEYYQPEFLEIRTLVSRIKHVTLGEISGKFKKGIFDIKADTYTDTGIPFVRISNLRDGLIDQTDIVFISPEANQKEKVTVLRKGDFVLSKTAYPAASLVTSNEVNISQDIIGVSIKKEWKDKVLSAYVVCFLNSKFGIAEMQQWFQGNIQMHLSLPDSKTILIPLLPIEAQQKISDLFKKSEDEIKNSSDLYFQAENLVLEELGLEDYQFEAELSSIVNFSEVKFAERMDAEYFQNKYEKLLNSLTNKQRLNEIAKRKNTLLIADSLVEYRYIEISDINVGSGDAGFHIVNGKDLPANAKLKIDGEELIISKVRPTRGAVAIIPKDWSKNIVASGAFSVFEVESPMREYLQVVLRSPIGKLQLERPTTGTSYPTINDSDVENIFIPVLDENIQQKIADLVKQSHEARKKAKELLEEAKHKVEELIEKGN